MKNIEQFMKHLKLYEQNADFDPFGEDIEVEYDIVIEKPGLTSKHVKGKDVNMWKDFYMNYDELFEHVKKLNPNKNL